MTSHQCILLGCLILTFLKVIQFHIKDLFKVADLFFVNMQVFINSQHFKEITLDVQLPSSERNWEYQEKSQTAICIVFKNFHGGVGIAKSLQILSTSKASPQVGGKNVTLPGCDGRYQGYDDIKRYLHILSNLKACKGFLNDAMAQKVSNSELQHIGCKFKVM